MNKTIKGIIILSPIRIISLVITILINIPFIHAGEVNPLIAEKAAANFLSSKVSLVNHLKSKPADGKVVNLVHTELLNNQPAFYIFNLAGQKGFVIISAEDAIRPVLGYSTATSFNRNDPKPVGFDSLILLYKTQIHQTRKGLLKASKNETTSWEQLLGSGITTAQLKATNAIVGPLVLTKWNQGCSYNNLCPVDAAGPCGKTWAGCVAVSMAQVLKYWNHPSSGEGSYSYNHFKYGTQSANFGAATYDWASMPNTSSNAEVAKLLYHLGVSVQMNYGTSGSGAYFSSTQTAITKYFKYSTNSIITSKFGYSEANWSSMLKRELDEERPIMYAGGTHAYVIDGYDTGDYFHVNWGWGGSYDGYFYLNNLKPGGYDFTNGQTALIGALPAHLETPYTEADVTEISCGVTKFDSTYNGKNRINRYKKNYTPATGKEKLYSFTTTYKGRIKAKLTGLNGKKLALFVLSYPHRDSLIVAGDSTVIVNNANAGKYYIAVDGTYGDEGKYGLTVFCPDNKADLSIIKTSVSPYMVEPLQPNVILSGVVKNFGNSISNATKLVYWYSEDNTLDLGDTKLDSVSINALNPCDSVIFSKNITMPAVSEGFKYIHFVVDPENMVNETDESDNVVTVGINVLPPSIMDCSSAISLQQNSWYKGNSSTFGNSLITNYGELRGYSGKEVIHTITSSYNGMATISFSKKSTLNLGCIILSACNENRFAAMVAGSEGGNKDTLSTIHYKVEKNQIVYLVIDGMQGASGEYWLKVAMPDSCPKPNIKVYSDTTVCLGGNMPYIYADYGFSTYQWLNNGFPVIAETNYYTQAKETGKYQVEVIENGCTGLSNSITITINSTPKPDIILIGTDSLKATVNADNYEWYYNNIKNSSYITQAIKPLQTGEYKVIAIKNTCKSETSIGYNYVITNITGDKETPIYISPNPTHGHIWIQNLNPAQFNVTIKIFHTNGLLIATKMFNSTENINIDLSDYPAGLYLIHVSTDKDQKIFKIIKE